MVCFNFFSFIYYIIIFIELKEMKTNLETANKKNINLQLKLNQSNNKLIELEKEHKGLFLTNHFLLKEP